MKLRQEIKAQGDLARELAKLKDHPSWDILRGEYEKKRDGYFNRLSLRLMSGGARAATVDQREIDYQRGFWAGAKWVIDNPDLAETALADALKKVSDERH